MAVRNFPTSQRQRQPERQHPRPSFSLLLCHPLTLYALLSLSLLFPVLCSRHPFGSSFQHVKTTGPTLKVLPPSVLPLIHPRGNFRTDS